MKQPTAIEQRLISDIQDAVAKHRQEDSREGGHFFDSSTVKVFQALAIETSQIIEQQGVKNTDERLIKVAKDIAQWGDIGWNHANTLGHAFSRNVEPAPASKANPGGTNPFMKMKL